MLQVIKSDERFHTQIGWLDSQHTFSFADHYHPERVGFRNLRVINDDIIAAAHGFGMHGHQDMEIFTYVLDGAVEHKDSMGTNGVIKPGDVQRMSAGTGVLHSEKNPLKDQPLHLLQIWILPRDRGVAPSYAQRSFAAADKRDVLKLVLTGDAANAANDPNGALVFNADADVYASLLTAGKSVNALLKRSGHGFVHVVKGGAEVNGSSVSTGDGVMITREKMVEIKGVAPETELLVFDLA